jgi:hypothetical protein
MSDGVTLFFFGAPSLEDCITRGGTTRTLTCSCSGADKDFFGKRESSFFVMLRS